MATIQVPISVNDEQQDALNADLERQNAIIAAEAARIEADKQVAAATGVPYVGPEPRTALTLADVVQERFDDRVQSDIRGRINVIAQDLAQIFITADPATRANMRADFDRYRQRPTPPTPQTAARRADGIGRRPR